MNVVISHKSEAPIYEQIKEQIRSAIIRGELAENQMLPSIRSLAQDLKISVITTMRAYTDLEAEGYIATVQGKGCFVLPKNKEYIREQKLKDIEAHFTDAIACGKLIELTQEELKKIFEVLLEE